MGLRVLIATNELQSRTGAPLYVRDLALELQRQGHSIIVYALEKGAISNELAEAGILTTDNLRGLDFQPEIIHAQNFTATRFAVQYFPGVPAIFVCHNHNEAGAPIHKQIYRYFGVSQVCVERLIQVGVPENQTALLLNFVDTKRFLPRPPLPEQPRRALVFSNYAKMETHLPAVTEACRQANLALDVVGKGVGNPATRPEIILGKYDLVFAKAKAAIEAMAVGAAVILCDFSGTGPMVTSAAFDELRPQNFGFQALRAPLRLEFILPQIERYDPQDAAIVRDLIRAEASLEQAVKNVVEIYQAIIEEHKQMPPNAIEKPILPNLLSYRAYSKTSKVWGSLKPAQKAFLKKVPGFSQSLTAIKNLLT